MTFRQPKQIRPLELDLFKQMVPQEMKLILAEITETGTPASPASGGVPGPHLDLCPRCKVDVISGSVILSDWNIVYLAYSKDSLPLVPCGSVGVFVSLFFILDYKMLLKIKRQSHRVNTAVETVRLKLKLNKLAELFHIMSYKM